MLNIIGTRRYYFLFSGALVFLSLLAVAVWGFKPSIDFTGGSLIQMGFTEARPTLADMQATVKKVNLGDAVVQPTQEKSYIVKLRFINETEHQALLTAFRTNYEKGANKVLEERIETIGPTISAVLVKRSWIAGVAVLAAIVLYVAYAFRRVSKPIASWKYGLAAVITLIHDVSIVMGVFAGLGHFFDIHVDIPFVVALLTVLGYSVNDTIVVFDRIRENLIRRSAQNFAETVNVAVNETIWRSLNTSLTVLLALLCLFVFGGETIHYFALALLIGIFFGTYSSIFLASPLLVSWELWDRGRRSR